MAKHADNNLNSKWAGLPRSNMILAELPVKTWKTGELAGVKHNFGRLAAQFF
jgi:hypothetical protein